MNASHFHDAWLLKNTTCSQRPNYRRLLHKAVWSCLIEFKNVSDDSVSKAFGRPNVLLALAFCWVCLWAHFIEKIPRWADFATETTTFSKRLGSQKSPERAFCSGRQKPGSKQHGAAAPKSFTIFWPWIRF